MEALQEFLHLSKKCFSDAKYKDTHGHHLVCQEAVLQSSESCLLELDSYPSEKLGGGGTLFMTIFQKDGPRSPRRTFLGLKTDKECI